jgi:hydrogenase maturation protein HypF
VSYVLGPLALPAATSRPLLACGAGDSVGVCLAVEAQAWIALGPESAPATADAVRAAADALVRRVGTHPEVLLHDPDPDSAGAAYARSRRGIERIAVDHHHAHMAALLAEHAVGGEAVVAVFDEGRPGPDGTHWGGELLRGDAAVARRRGLLFPVRLPGATRSSPPAWQVACSWLSAALGTDDPERPAALAVGEEEWQLACERVRFGIESPLTTSVGRLLQAAGALLGADPAPTGAGLPAAPADSVRASGAYRLPLIADGDAPVIIDARPAIRAILADLEEGVTVDVIGTRLRMGLAEAVAAGCAELAAAAGVEEVGLAGDSFADDQLRELTAAALREHEVGAFAARRLPPGDVGIALGQAYIGAARRL